MKVIEGELNAGGLKFALIAARFNSFVVERLIDGAVDALTRLGAASDDLTLVRVPGAWEIPAVLKRLLEAGKYDAVICLGAVIRGGTPHFEYVASEVSKGVAQLGMAAKIPVSFGVLTCDSVDQAVERAGAKAGNKGVDAAMAAVEMANLFAVI